MKRAGTRNIFFFFFTWPQDVSKIDKFDIHLQFSIVAGSNEVFFYKIPVKIDIRSSCDCKFWWILETLEELFPATAPRI